ncbi:hypothetical protein AB0N98_25315 [Streptomyces sp. NPDC093681]|uniref:hypothetical protein n=1 Tax=Streptomyces sp. NPDC093681 TaxID=3155202 RepID=UPI0034169BBF
MTKYDFDLPPKASPEVIAEREELADEVCRELERAGLPVHRGGLEAGPHDRPGADVHVDIFEDGGVYVDWNSAKELRDAALQLFEKGIDFTNPPRVVVHHKNVHDHMQSALLGILVSAGFQVEEADRFTHGTAVLVKERQD